MSPVNIKFLVLCCCCWHKETQAGRKCTLMLLRLSRNLMLDLHRWTVPESVSDIVDNVGHKLEEDEHTFAIFCLNWANNTVFFNKSMCFVETCPSSIQRWNSNLQPLKHESSPITTRPGLPFNFYHLPVQVKIFKGILILSTWLVTI